MVKREFSLNVSSVWTEEKGNKSGLGKGKDSAISQ
jgi:hypothetical protein